MFTPEEAKTLRECFRTLSRLSENLRLWGTYDGDKTAPMKAALIDETVRQLRGQIERLMPTTAYLVSYIDDDGAPRSERYTAKHHATNQVSGLMDRGVTVTFRKVTE